MNLVNSMARARIQPSICLSRLSQYLKKVFTGLAWDIIEGLFDKLSACLKYLPENFCQLSDYIFFIITQLFQLRVLTVRWLTVDNTQKVVFILHRKYLFNNPVWSRI